MACSVKGYGQAGKQYYKKEKEKIPYTTTILNTNINCCGGTWEALFADTSFVNLCEHSLDYVDSAIQFISNDKFDYHQKMTCILSMQKLSIKNYTRLLEVCINLFEKDKISELQLENSIDPNFGKRRVIIKNYDTPEVKRLLNKIKNGKKISLKFNSHINQILSGHE